MAGAGESGAGEGSGFDLRQGAPPPAPPPRLPRSRLRRWLRGSLLALAGLLVLASVAVVWFVLNPSQLLPTVERIATGFAGRSVLIGGLDFRLEEGRALVEVEDLRIGRTTTERALVSLRGGRSYAEGSGVRFPNGSFVDGFRATLDLSWLGPPRVSTVDATGARFVVARARAGDAGAAPRFERLLVVPRILLELGLERLSLRSSEIEYRGRALTRTAGLNAVVETTDGGLALRGELEVLPGMPPLPFEGTVQDPLTDDWSIELGFVGERVSMEGVDALASVLEPGPRVRENLRRISNETRFRLSVRLAPAAIEAIDLDFSFGAPRPAADDALSLEGVRFLARAAPDPSGWTVNGEVDWTKLPSGSGTEPSPFTAAWSRGSPGSLEWSAERVAIPPLADLARRSLAPAHPFRARLDRLAPEGMIAKLVSRGVPAGDETASAFRLSADLSGFGATAGDVEISEASGRIELAGGEWRIRFADDRFKVAVPSVWSTPVELTVSGETRIAAADDGWSAQAEGLAFAVAGFTGLAGGRFRSPPRERNEPPALDLDLRVDEVALATVADALPDRRGERFADWFRRAARSGRLTGAALRIRGDPTRFPFRDGGGELTARGRLEEVDFAYARGWPEAHVREAAVEMTGLALEFRDIAGRVFDSSVEKGFARVPDLLDPAGRLTVSLSGSGPAGDLLDFVRDSPLGQRATGAILDLRAEGPTAISAELDIPYGRGAASRPLESTGSIVLDGVGFRLAGRRATLEDVRGTLRFDATSLSGGPLSGRLRGAAIESHIDFDRDTGLRLRFSGEGDGEWFGGALLDLVNLERNDTEPWLTNLDGSASWTARYDSRAGIVFSSGLDEVAVDLPPPFAKPAGTARELRVHLVPGDSEWLIDAAYGADTRARFEVVKQEEGWGLARGGVSLGGGSPVLPSEEHIEISGHLSELDLGSWLALGAEGSDDPKGWSTRVGRVEIEAAKARAFGRRIALRTLRLTRPAGESDLRVELAGEGVAGVAVLPVGPAAGEARIRLERLHFGERLEEEEAGDGASPKDADPEPVRMGDWPSFTARVGSLRIGNIELGSTTAVGRRTEDGFEVEELRIVSPDLRMEGRGGWRTGEDGALASHFKAEGSTEDISRVLTAAGLEADAMAAGPMNIRMDLAWPRSPFGPEIEDIEGEIEFEAEDGKLPRVRVGALGRLLALLSLDALPRVLSLDLSHVFGKGLTYDRLVVRTHLRNGHAEILELALDGPAAWITVSGGLDLAARRYDQEVSVVPRLTRSGALLPAWATVWPVLLGNFLLEKVTRDELSLNRLFKLRYRVTGPWDEPQIKRTGVFPSALTQ